MVTQEKVKAERTFLAVQWLRLHTSTAGGMGSIPGLGTKNPYATKGGQKKKLVVIVSSVHTQVRKSA